MSHTNENTQEDRMNNNESSRHASTKRARPHSNKNSIAIVTACGCVSMSVLALLAPASAFAVGPLIVNDFDFGSSDPGQCQYLSGTANTAVQVENCGGSQTAGYNNAMQTGAVAVANQDLSVGGYQFINGADANGDALTITDAGKNIRLNDGKVTNLAAGTDDADAVNFGQLKNTAQSVADALGGGSVVNSDGTVSAPVYELTQANAINGTTGAASDVGTAFVKVDDALGKLDQSITQLTTNIEEGQIGLVRRDPATGNLSVASNKDGALIDFSGTQGARTMTGVSAGELSAASTDAVNGSQLYQTNVQVSNLTQRVGDVETAVSVVASDKHTQRAVATGADATALGNGAMATGANAVALGSGSVADQDNTVSIGAAGSERRLLNLAPGVNGTDAVNMNQLNALQGNVDAVARGAFAGVAAAMAMPNLAPKAPGHTVIAAGVANYKGYTAVGVGGTYRSNNDRWLINAAASFTPRGDTGVRGQVGYDF
jgi:trimeric autotransporter adhesin